MKITFALALVIAIFCEKSSQQCFRPYNENQPNRNAHADLYSGQQEFSLALLNAINKVMPTENLFFSPYSTYHALMIAYFISGGQTESYLRKILRLQDNLSKADFYAAYKTDKFLNNILAKNAKYEFISANKIYVAEDIKIRQCIPNDFPDELELKSFRVNPEAARISINEWVENTTHHMIKDLLPPGTIDQTTDLALVNAAYFKGMWENKFNPNLTKQEVFYVNPSKQIMVDMMHLEGTFRHDISETLGAHILEMPYQGDNISMYILLPPFANTENSIEATLKNLTLENFRKVVDSNEMTARTVQLAFPKFSLETIVEMTPILEYMGVGNLFQHNADFSILTEDKNLNLDRALHKAKIEVNEDGTKAAAATAFFSFRSSRPIEPAQFICNHPFIYVIFDKIQRSVLFTGIFRRPY